MALHDYIPHSSMVHYYKLCSTFTQSIKSINFRLLADQQTLLTELHSRFTIKWWYTG